MFYVTNFLFNYLAMNMITDGVIMAILIALDNSER